MKKIFILLFILTTSKANAVEVDEIKRKIHQLHTKAYKHDQPIGVNKFFINSGFYKGSFSFYHEESYYTVSPMRHEYGKSRSYLSIKIAIDRADRNPSTIMYNYDGECTSAIEVSKGKKSILKTNEARAFCSIHLESVRSFYGLE
jgi:hypothetical protein